MPEPDTTEGEPDFVLPIIADNADGWGPPVSADPLDIPYAPFSKSDRLGKIADWTAPAPGEYGYDRYQDRRDATGRRNFRGQGLQEAFGTGTASAFLYQHSAEEEASFSVIDRTSQAIAQRKLGFGGGRGGFAGRGGSQRGGRFGARGGFSDGGRGGSRMVTGRGGFNQNSRGGRRYGYNDKPQRLRDASIQVQPDWRMIEEIDFVRLNKLSFDVPAAKDLAIHGTISYYNKEFDRLSSKSEKRLQQIDRCFYNVTTSEDPVIQKLAKKYGGPTVFATDNVLVTLMCAPRSVYPWDIVITKEDDKIFFDKRPGGHFDFVTVNENAPEAPVEGTEKDNINSPGLLAQEATYINRNFSQQVLKDGEALKFKRSHPFYEPEQDSIPPSQTAFRYREWPLGEDVTLVVRTSIDAALYQAGANSVQTTATDDFVVESEHDMSDTVFLTLRALNEFDPRAIGSGNAPDWRTKLDSQRGAVMATEMKNNSNKLAKWTLEAMLAGADQMRIGFVSRVSPKDRNRHVMLGTGFFKPKEYATQMNFNVNNAWGILKTIVDLCFNKLDDGKFVLVKDPNKPTIRLYQVPPSTFEDSEVEYAGENVGAVNDGVEA
ncbi:eukaryotic translation initiation factor 3 subunit D [Cladochytrium replicatum]|nr:eukaryotic translation initiation factor 3 subunit D [Cladochytrium replicatum]